MFSFCSFSQTIAEQKNSSPESTTTSRIKTLSDALTTAGINFGSVDAGSWGNWCDMWNRIYSAAMWKPSDADATIADVANGKKFYAGNTRTLLTGKLGSPYFGTKVDYPFIGSGLNSGGDLYGVATEKLNNDNFNVDNKIDVAVGSQGYPTVSVFLNTY